MNRLWLLQKKIFCKNDESGKYRKHWFGNSVEKWVEVGKLTKDFFKFLTMKTYNYDAKKWTISFKKSVKFSRLRYKHQKTQKRFKGKYKIAHLLFFEENLV